KYRDPLLFAAKDLQYRLINILDMGVLHMDIGKNQILQNQLQYYTFFAFGQLLSWIFILRRQAQFVCFGTQKENQKLIGKLDQIHNELSTAKYGHMAECMLWRGQQMALGEVMSEKDKNDEDQLFCIGYSRFVEKFAGTRTFREWFLSLDLGMERIKAAQSNGDRVPDWRLRHLHHLLLDLIDLLKPESLHGPRWHPKRCDSAPCCPCDTCTQEDQRKGWGIDFLSDHDAGHFYRRGCQ
ncbi:hypothetical protein B0I35DRAFT_363057, partial [Stachybotrys elegans]